MAFKNLFSNYFNGNPSKPDMTEKDLPANRVQLFITVLKIRLFSLSVLNLLYILSWIPAAAWTVMNAMAIPAMSETSSLSSLIITYVVILAPLILLTGPSNMGISFVTREWARDRHADTYVDFRDAFKANWKQGLLLALLNAAVLLFSVVGSVCYYQISLGNILSYIAPAFIFIFAVLWDLTSMLMPTMLLTYDQRFFAQLSNAFIITIAELPRAVLIRLATMIVPLVSLAVMLIFPEYTSVCISVGTSLYIFLMPAFNKLLIASYANMVCEKYINPKIEGAETDIGLRPKK